MKQQVKQIFKKIPVVYPLWHGMRLRINENREKRKKAAFDHYAIAVLDDLMKMTTAKGYPCVCIYGTLLGPVRDGHLIPWDDDMDFAILDTPDFSWARFEKDMRDAGFWKYRTLKSEGNICGQSYKKKDVLCDFAIFPVDGEPKMILSGAYEIPGYVYENGKPAMYRVWDEVIPPITGISTMQMDGINIKIPINSEEMLAAAYGEGWRHPDPNFVPAKEEKEKEYTITYFRKPFLR